MIDMLFNEVGWTDIRSFSTVSRLGCSSCSQATTSYSSTHRILVNELAAPHIPAVRISQWWVPTIEFTAGSAVFIGLLAPLAALGLVVIILVASATSGRQRIKAYKPIDEADRIDDWLYPPETLYGFMLIMVISAGAGPYSLDAAILGPVDKPGMLGSLETAY
jgi:uncharacterized membrane protein YphA (DoxX/SURF4 family)